MPTGENEKAAIVGGDGRRRARLFGLIGVALTAGFILGYVAHKNAWIWHARRLAAAVVDERFPPAATPITETHITTTFHTLRVVRLRTERAWSLAELDGDRLLFSSNDGRLGYVAGHQLHDLGLVAPLNLEAFLASPAGRADTVLSNHIRVTDLLPIPAGPNAVDLYVAHLEYFADENCFRLAVHQRRLEATPNAVRAIGDEWRRVFQTRDCVGMRPSGYMYLGQQSGGRLVRYDNATLALSIGDFEVAGADAEHSTPSDPTSDLGKVLLVPTDGGQPRILATGMRNPQGLLMARDGRLWQTEHGPRGGDEVNLVVAGRDYGWPHVTYGVGYGDVSISPSMPPNALQGSHDGYERPRIAFTPSIGISNLIEADTQEFPAWDSHLLVASLRGEALRLLRVEGDQVVYDEPISLAGSRLRDIIALSDGRIAIATDDGDILIISNAERSRRGPRGGETLSGLGTLPRPNFSQAEQALGARLFALHCSQCHAFNNEVRAGPPLDGVVGQRVGAYPDYAYSAALAGRRETWSRSRLRDFIRHSERTYPGTSMPQPSVADDAAARAIVDYLASRDAREPRQRRNQ